MRLLARSRLLPLLLAAAAARSVSSASPRSLAPPLRDLAALDAQFSASLQQVAHEQQQLAERLDALRRGVDALFAGERRETLAFVRETRAKMLGIRLSLREEMRAALEETQALLAAASGNATAAIEQHKAAAAGGSASNRTRTCDVGPVASARAGVPWSAILLETATGAVVGLAHYYEQFAVALVLALWVLVQAAAVVAVLVLATAAVVRLRVYQRARRKPRVVYSGYLRSVRVPTERLETEATSARP